jgi:hypothetical protein
MKNRSRSRASSMNALAFVAPVALAAFAQAAVAQTYGNISQNQSGWGNSQSISIGNTDAKPAKKGKKLSSSQHDPDTGNTQSANVSGSAQVSQSQGGRDNTQTADVDGSGNISQNQSGRYNSQSISIGSGVNSGGTSGNAGSPSLYQSQTGVNRKQSIKIDGKKVETKDE